MRKNVFAKGLSLFLALALLIGVAPSVAMAAGRPAITEATATTTQVTLQWTNADTLTSFTMSGFSGSYYTFVQCADTAAGEFRTVTYGASNASATTRTFNATLFNYVPGGTYYFRLVQRSSGAVVYSDAVEVTMQENRPVITQATTSGNQVTLQWTNADGRVNFRPSDYNTNNSHITFIQYAESAGGEFKTVRSYGLNESYTSLTFAGSYFDCIPGQTYYFRIVQKVNTTFVYSNVVEVAMQENRPVITQATTAGNKVSLQWTNADGRVAFLPEDYNYNNSHLTFIQYAESVGGEFKTVRSYGLNESYTSLTFAGSYFDCIPGQTYYFRIVQKVNTTFVYSNVVEVAMQENRPVITQATTAGNKVSLQWTNADGLVYFLPEDYNYNISHLTFIQYAESAGGEFRTVRSYGQNSSTSLTFDGSYFDSIPGQTYYFRIIQKVNTTFVYSNVVEVAMQENKPVITQATATATRVTLQWTNADGRVYFLPEDYNYNNSHLTFIQYAESAGGEFKTVRSYGVNSNTSLTFDGSYFDCIPGQTYYFRIIQKVNATFVYSNVVEVAMQESKPVITHAAATATRVTLQWTNADGRVYFLPEDYNYNTSHLTYIQYAESAGGEFKTVRSLGLNSNTSLTFDASYFDYTPGQTYYFRIIQKVNATFVYSNVVPLRIAAGESYSYETDWTAGLVVAKSTPFSVALKWNSDWNGAAGAPMRFNPSSGEFEALEGTVTKTSGGVCYFTDSSEVLVPEGAYRYIVRYGSGAGAHDSPEVAVVLPENVRITGLLVQQANLGNVLRLQWNPLKFSEMDAAAYSGQYLIQRYDEDLADYVTVLATTSCMVEMRMADALGRDLRLITIHHGIVIPADDIVLDQNVPLANPPALTAGHNSAGTAIFLSWEDDTSHIGISAYWVYRDNAVIHTGLDTEWTDSGARLGQTYSYYVISRDALGRFSDKSNIVVIRAPDDVDPPSVPQSLRLASRTLTSVTIYWNASTDNQGIDRYEVYRNGALIAEPRAVHYQDSDSALSQGQSYAYEVLAVDVNGLKSAKSKPLTLVFNQAPVVSGITPEDGSTLGSDAAIRVSASCVNPVRLIRVWYSLKDADDWALLGAANVSGTNVRHSFTWATAGLPEDDYDIKAVAYDAVSVASEPYYVAYTLRTAPPEHKPVLTASLVPDTMSVLLSWTDINENPFLFNIYRRTSGTPYRMIRAFPGDYSDKRCYDNLSGANTYYYRVDVLDQYGNAKSSDEVSVVVPFLDRTAPVAVMGFTYMNVLAGEPVAFDASNSSDNVGIASYQWNVGGEAVAGASFVRTFTATGAVNVTLTVRDAAGNSATMNGVVNVVANHQTADGEYAKTVLTIRDKTSGRVVQGALVKVQLKSGDILEQYSDGDGKCVFVFENGLAYEARAYKAGYASSTGIVITAGEDQTVYLSDSPIVVGDIQVERMTIDEIIAAGIDINNPDNQHVFKYTIVVELEGIGQTVQTYYCNDKCQTVAASNDLAARPVGYGGYIGVAYPIVSVTGGSFWTGSLQKEKPPAVAYLVINGETSWLKEMFDVTLTIVNTSDTDWVADANVTLKIPDGLSLAALVAGSQQSAVVSIGDVEPGGKSVTHWYLRGDREGEYDIEADFAGMLLPFPETVEATFRSEKPLKVLGGKAMEIHVTLDRRVTGGTIYRADFELRNVADFDIYNLTMSLGSAMVSNNLFTALEALERGETLFEGDSVFVPALHPGESIVLPFQVLFPDVTDDGTITEYFVRNAFAVTREGSTAEIPIYFGWRELPWRRYSTSSDVYVEIGAAFKKTLTDEASGRWDVTMDGNRIKLAVSESSAEVTGVSAGYARVVNTKLDGVTHTYDIYVGDNTIKGVFTHKGGVVDEDFEDEFTYSDSYFDGSAYRYKHDLAIMSMCLSLSAFSKIGAEYPEHQSDHLKNLLHKIGFDENTFEANEDYYQVPSFGDPSRRDTIGVGIARKVLVQESGEPVTVIAVAIRGGGYEREWGSNFKTGAGNLHEGFEEARNETLRFLRAYLLNHRISGRVKIWITGYSRAAATANLTAAALDAGFWGLGVPAPQGVAISPDDIYAYCFETPAGALLSSGTDSKLYRNIFTVANPNDFVPRLAPSEWGYSRYGVTKWIPDSVNHYQYGHYKELMLDEFDEIGGMSRDDYKVDSLESPVPSLVNARPMSVFLDELVSRVAEMMRSPEFYVGNYQDALSMIMASVLGGLTPEQEREMLLLDSGLEVELLDIEADRLEVNLIPQSVKNGIAGGRIVAAYREYIDNWMSIMHIDDLPAVPVIYDIVAPLLLDELASYAKAWAAKMPLNKADMRGFYISTLLKNGKTFEQGHYPELCLAWLRASSAFPYALWEGEYRIARMNCPLDVEVYDCEDTLVAKIVNDEPIPVEGSSIVAAVDLDGQKIIYLPSNEDYTIKLTATGDGAMTYSINEYTPDGGRVTRVVNYCDVPIATGDVLYGLTENKDDISPLYPLTRGSERFTPEDLSGDDEMSFTVTAAAVGNGSAIGGGTRVKGEFIQLVAVPDENAEFLGWRVGGRLVSSEAEYRFRVDSNVEVTATFTESAGDTFRVSGMIRSYSPKTAATIRLMQGGAEMYATTIEPAGGIDQVVQPFAFSAVAPGSYSLVVTKPGHTRFTVHGVIVAGQDLDLTQDSRAAVRVMTLLCGDINGDDMINDSDLTTLWMVANYNKSAASAAEPRCDINGDGMINDADLTILWMVANYNKGPVVIDAVETPDPEFQ